MACHIVRHAILVYSFSIYLSENHGKGVRLGGTFWIRCVSTSVRGDPCLTCLLDQYNRHRRVDDAEGASNAGRTTGSIRVIPQASGWNPCASESQQCCLKVSPSHHTRRGASACPPRAPFVALIRSVRCRDWSLSVSWLHYGVVTGYPTSYKNPLNL